MGTMYDAVDVAAIPKDATIVAGYVDGNWPTYGALVKAFPNAQRVSITTIGVIGAMVGDCETGDLTPQTAAEWAKARLQTGRRPCIYYARSNAQAVGAALAAVGVAVGDVDFWVADWTGVAHLVPGSVATQYSDPRTSGGNFDISETIEGWPPPPPEPPTEGETMTSIVTGGQLHVWAVIGNVTWHWWQELGPPASAWHVEQMPS